MYKPKPIKSDDELIKSFWDLPLDAYAIPRMVALIRGISISTLDKERYFDSGIPFRRIRRRVLYKKSDVLNFIENNGCLDKAG